MRIQAEIGERDTRRKWKEKFSVKSWETAEEEIKRAIEGFNNTLRPGEKPRKFIKLLKEEPVDYDSYEGFLELAAKFRAEVAQEDDNAFGNAWCKAHYVQVDRLFRNLGRMGNITRFKRLVSRSPYRIRQEFRELIDSKLKTVKGG